MSQSQTQLRDQLNKLVTEVLELKLLNNELTAYLADSVFELMKIAKKEKISLSAPKARLYQMLVDSKSKHTEIETKMENYEKLLAYFKKVSHDEYKRLNPGGYDIV